MDENLHHTEGEIPEVVVEKPKLRNFTEEEIRIMVDRHINGWADQCSLWSRIWRVIGRLDRRKRHYMMLIGNDRKNGSGLDLRIQLGISGKASLHSKLIMLTAKWMVDTFIQSAAQHEPRTIDLIMSLPFVMVTKEDPDGNR